MRLLRYSTACVRLITRGCKTKYLSAQPLKTSSANMVFRYQYLDRQKRDIDAQREENPSQTFQESLEVRIQAFGGEEKWNWIYGNDIEQVWRDFLAEEKGNAASSLTSHVASLL